MTNATRADLFGFLTIVAQILWCVWIAATTTKQAVVVSCLAGFCLLPCIAFTLAPFLNGLRRVYVKEDEPSLESGDHSSQFRDRSGLGNFSFVHTMANGAPNSSGVLYSHSAPTPSPYGAPYRF